MAEAAAAFYTIETALEGAALGAFAISRPTVPLHLRFRKVKPPGDTFQIKDHTVNVVKGRAYLLGGVKKNEHGKPGSIHVLTLPASLGSLEKYVEPLDVDNEVISSSSTAVINLDRSAHSSVQIGNSLYLIGGWSNGADRDFISLDEITLVDTTTNATSTISADISKCRDGPPQPRSYPSSTASASLNTVFLHGGFDLDDRSLNDTWAFNIASRVWIRLPSAPGHVSSQVNTITFTESDCRLWSVDNISGEVSFLEFVQHKDEENTQKSSIESIATPSVLNISLKGEGQWEIAYPVEQASKVADETGMSQKPSKGSGPSTQASVFPITTGAGRRYLLFLPPKLFTANNSASESLPRANIMAFQLPSETTTLASIKDTIRDKLPGTAYTSGKYEWSRCEVIDSTMQDGPVDAPNPGSGMVEWAADVVDVGDSGTIMICGGISDENTKWEDGGWLMSAE